MLKWLKQIFKKKESPYWVIYTPKRHCSANESNGWKPKEEYLDDNGGWTTDVSKAKRFNEYQNTINHYTQSKLITIKPS